MCGIAGIIKPQLAPSDHKFIYKMTDSIFHRGPDGEGYWNDGEEKVLLGHRRLAIIDLSETGSQPMHYQNRYTIVHNGEIYNYIELKHELVKKGHRFVSSSDTEVLLAMYAEYKENCLQYLDGMFAFAIYDEQEKKLFCARDRFGEKPFYYHFEKGKQFYFGSEMKALWAAGIKKTVNNNMLYNFLMYSYIENPEDSSQTFFDGCIKLPASHYLELDVNSLTISLKKYWDINWKEQSQNISLNHASEKIRELFNESVKKRLRSDVSIGSSLSGGLDSSLIVYTIDAFNKDKSFAQQTFSAQFGMYDKDESLFQHMVTGQLNADANFTYPTEDELLSNLDNIFYYQEEPFTSASVAAQFEVYKLAAMSDVTVLLDGQGADEIFAGYFHYYQPYLQEIMRKSLKQFTKEYKLCKTFDTSLPDEPDWKFYAESYGQGMVNKFSKTIKWWQQKEVRKNLSGEFSKQGKSFQYYFHGKTLNEALYQSIRQNGLENLLRYADRNSMSFAREVRLPFLNHQLVEFVFSLPTSLKIKDGWTKYILRHTFEDILPKEICWRRDKVGFEPPQRRWMESKPMQQIVKHFKQILVNERILNQKAMDQKPDNAGPYDQVTSDWNYLMAGHLLC